MFRLTFLRKFSKMSVNIDGIKIYQESQKDLTKNFIHNNYFNFCKWKPNINHERKKYQPDIRAEDTSDNSQSLSNIFQLKNHKDLKKIYYMNQLYLYTGAQINKIVDMLDFYVTLNQKNTIKSAEDILTQDSFCQELIRQILKSKRELDNKSVLKIFNLNCNLFTKNVVRNENLNKLAFSLTKDINFDKFFKNLQKHRNVSDLFLHLNNMQNIIKSDKIGDYKVSLNEPKNFFYFKVNLFSKCILNKIELDKFPTLTLASLFWVYGKNGIKQIDVFDSLIRELSKRMKFLNVKNLITILNVIERFNFFDYDRNILKNLIKKLNSSTEELEKELKTSDISYMISLLKFLTSYKIFSSNQIEFFKFQVDEEILKIVDKACMNYLNKEISIEDYNLSLILKYFFLFQKEKNLQFVLDKIFDRYSNMMGNPVINIFSLFFYINFDQSHNQNFLQQFNQLFFELFQIADLERSKLNYKEYLQTVFCLFQIDYFSTRVKNLTINEKIRNFIASLLNEKFLNKISEDYYETKELLEILNLVNIHNQDLYEKMKITCESELNIMLNNKYEISEEDKSDDSEESDANMIKIDDFEKKNFYSLQSIINILLIIKSLNIKIENSTIEGKFLENLKSQRDEKNKLSMEQKYFYNCMIKGLNMENVQSEEHCEITKYDVENNFLKHDILIERCLAKIKEIKSSLYIEKNFILDKKIMLDIYIPSLKKAYIININSGVMQCEKHISFPNINKEHILFGLLTRHVKSLYDIDLQIINEDLIVTQSKEKMILLNNFWTNI